MVYPTEMSMYSIWESLALINPQSSKLETLGFPGFSARSECLSQLKTTALALFPPVKMDDNGALG